MGEERRVQKKQNNQHFKQLPRLLPRDRLEPGKKNKEQKQGRSEEEEKKKTLSFAQCGTQKGIK